MVNSFLVRITQLYTYKADDVQLGAVFINQNYSGAHRVKIITTQNRLNMKPTVGQQWKIIKEDNYSVRQQITKYGGYIDVYTFMEPKLECVMPDSGAGFVNFLSKEKSFSGIGKIIAQLLWDEFRSDIFSMLEEGKSEPYRKNTSISNFDAIKSVVLKELPTNNLFQGYQKYNNLKHASRLVEYGIDEPIQRQLFRLASHDAIKFLEANPYRLFSLGMRFPKVDAIAKNHFNIPLSSDLRLKAVIEHALRLWGDNGHTVASWSDIVPAIGKLLDNDWNLINKAKGLEGEVIGFVKEDDNYFISGNYIFEKTIAKRFKKLSYVNYLWSANLENAFNCSIPKGWTLTEKQQEAVRTALTSSIFALTGGAGTGKTTTLKVIVDAYKAMKYKIYPVALSGKAARRLQQSIGLETSTIAKLLNSKDNYSDWSMLLVDEASMLDAYTMWRLVTQFPDTTRILLVGDPYQLPPINAGFILSDVVKCGIIPHVELDVVKRQGATSSIPPFANSIRMGLMPYPLTTPEISFKEPKADIIGDAVDSYKVYPNAMIVAGTNKTVRKVNIKVQELVNSKGKVLDLSNMPVTHSNYEFREGDSVVITLTCYKNDVRNGTLATIIGVEACDEYACIIELDEDLDLNGNKRQLQVDWNLLEYIDLAYCLTLHKLQGSQAENVIVLLEENKLLDRSWLYTAITRTENMLHIISTPYTFYKAIREKGAIDVRKTGLTEMLKNA
jgi:exodeoxyribonuclease V alpha subunit